MPEITPTILLQIALSAGLFVALWYYLGKNVFGPFIKVIEEREEKTVGVEKFASDAKEEVRRETQKLEALRLEARLEGIRARDELIVSAKSKADELLAATTARVEGELAGIKAEIEKLRASLLPELDQEAEKLSQALVAKLTSSENSKHKNITIH
jgi:F0F1-type ATP synthase membrane subunit b/b'